MAVTLVPSKKLTKDEDSPEAPLSTPLSQLLIAFTIEFDNEFEHRMPHRTTSFGLAGGQTRGPWLGSMVLWANGMRLVPESGIKVGELERQAGTDKLQLAGLERWGYISVTPGPADSGKKPSARESLVRPTEMGRKAQEVWRPLAGEIEERWRMRFGKDTIDAFRASLSAVLGRIDLPLPEYLPILGYGLFSEILLEEAQASGPHSKDALAQMNLCTLLSKVLLAYAIEFEFDWKISLAISANLLRLLDEKGLRIADLPRLSGIAKEGMAFATGWLERNGYAAIEADPKSKGKIIRLTPKGQVAQQTYRQRLVWIEANWQERFGSEAITALRESALAVMNQKTALSEGLRPCPDGWRARKPYVSQTVAFLDDPAGSLPHFPMVLHRGGYPDGS